MFFNGQPRRFFGCLLLGIVVSVLSSDLAHGAGHLYATKWGFVPPITDTNTSRACVFKFDESGNKVDEYCSGVFSGFANIAVGPGDGRIYVNSWGVSPNADPNSTEITAGIISLDPDDLSGDVQMVVDDLGSFFGGQGWPQGKGIRNMGFDGSGKLVVVPAPFGTPQFVYSYRINIEANGSGTAHGTNPFWTDGPSGGFFGQPTHIGSTNGHGIREKNGFMFLNTDSDNGISVYDASGNWISGTQKSINPSFGGGTEPRGGTWGPDINNDGVEDLYVGRNSNGGEGRVTVVSGKEIFDGTFPSSQPPVLSTDYTNNLTDTLTGADDHMNGSNAIQFLSDGRLVFAHNPQATTRDPATSDAFCGIKVFDPDTGQHSVFADVACSATSYAVPGGLTVQVVKGPDGMNGMLFVPDTATYNPADFNEDGKVDPSDFAILAGNWLNPGGSSTGDANRDGFVDPSDFAMLAGNWLLGVGGSAGALNAVPEPSTLLLGGLALLAILAYGYRRIF